MDLQGNSKGLDLFCGKGLARRTPLCETKPDRLGTSAAKSIDRSNVDLRLCIDRGRAVVAGIVLDKLVPQAVWISASWGEGACKSGFDGVFNSSHEGRHHTHFVIMGDMDTT